MVLPLVQQRTRGLGSNNVFVSTQQVDDVEQIAVWVNGYSPNHLKYLERVFSRSQLFERGGQVIPAGVPILRMKFQLTLKHLFCGAFDGTRFL